MSETGSKVLLYPQTFLPPESGFKSFSLVSKLIVLKSCETLENWENAYKNFPLEWKEKIEFLKFRDHINVNWEQMKKEVEILENWGFNFRTLENLKYFAQFKEILEDTLEEISPAITNKNPDKKYLDEMELRRALITLSLGERVDVRLYEVSYGLEEIKKKYKELLEKEIISEDYTFEKFLEAEDPFFLEDQKEELPNLKIRILIWKIIGKYIDWGNYKDLDGLLITEEGLLENWKEKFDFEKETLSSGIEIYKFYASFPELLDLSKENLSVISFPPRVIFLK